LFGPSFAEPNFERPRPPHRLGGARKRDARYSSRRAPWSTHLAIRLRRAAPAQRERWPNGAL